MVAPDGYDFERAGPVRRAVRLLVTLGPVARLSARLLPGADRLVARLTGGRTVLSAWVTGLPVLQMTSTGARSGERRTVRVLGVPAAGGVLVVGANFGGTRDPAWCHNLRAHPVAVLELADGPVEHAATELQGAERLDGFERAARLNPGWQRFQTAAGERPIPVFLLTPRPTAAPGRSAG